MKRNPPGHDDLAIYNAMSASYVDIATAEHRKQERNAARRLIARNAKASGWTREQILTVCAHLGLETPEEQ